MAEKSTPQTENSLGTPSPALVRALKLMLKPLVRLLLANGITYPFLTNVLKGIYVEVADKEFPLDDKKQTDSRISLLTGVHRKDTRRLRNQDINDNPPPENLSTSAQLIACWVGKAEYLDENGQPLPLLKKSPETSEVDFETLVKNVSKQDLRPRVVLDEWLRLGIVHIDSDNRIVLNTQAFIPKDNFEEKAYYFGQNLHDHIAAGTHNLVGGTKPFFDRSVYYNCLTEESVEKLNRLSNELGMQALKAINSEAMQLQETDHKLATAQERINFGIYFYHATEKSNSPAPNDKTSEIQEGGK